jgi:hypothetical protein
LPWELFGMEEKLGRTSEYQKFEDLRIWEFED